MDFFSKFSDEVHDISNHEQLAVIIRFVDKENRIKEEFLAFINISESPASKILSKELLPFICKVGLDPQRMTE